MTARRCIRATALRAVPLLVLLAAACGEGGGADGPSLAPVTALPSPAGEGSAEPRLALGPEGRVYLSWQEPGPDSTYQLRFATLEGKGWSAPRTIAAGGDWFVNWADFPTLAALPDGRIAAHYLQRSPEAEVGYHYDIRVVQSADGGATWSAPVTPHRDSVPAEHGFVSMYPATGDSLGLVWLDGRKSHARYGGSAEMTLRATTLAPDGALGEEVVLDERICDCCQTSVAMTARGPVVAYRDRTEAEVRDIYLARRTERGWETGRPVHADGWEIAACPVNGPAVDAAGEQVVVAWFTAARDTPRVQLAFSSDAGATFGAPLRIDAGDPAGRVDVQLLPGGGALVSWIERTAEGAEIRARHARPDGTLAPGVTLAASSGERSSGFPRMVVADGRVVLAWTEPGTPSRVRTAVAPL